MSLYELESFRDDLVHLRNFLINDASIVRDEKIWDVIRELKWRIRDVNVQISNLLN